jgi:starch synthase
LEAAADILFMPSLFEPCGLNQIYSMKYGTVPIVRSTGGLEDSVAEFNPYTCKGTGFKFRGDNISEIMQIIKNVLTMHKDQKLWRIIQRNGMAMNFSWDNAVVNYLNLYNKLKGTGNHG